MEYAGFYLLNVFILGMPLVLWLTHRYIDGG